MNSNLRTQRRVASEVALGTGALCVGVFIVVAGALAPPGFGGAGAFGNLMAYVIGAGSMLFGASFLRGALMVHRMRGARFR